MDPLTQGALGAVTAQALGPRSLGKHNGWIGGLAGMAADLDVLIRSAEDPLIAVEYHRHFTHALAFAPIGAVAVALSLWLLLGRGRRERFRLGALYVCCLIAYLTHAPLDACTSYGTLLLWPFSDERIAWDWLPVVDPIVTAGLLLGFGSSLRRGTRRGAWTALGFFVLYTAIASLLHARALASVHAIAELRGETATMARAMPKLPTILVWRSIYRTDEAWVVDGLRVIPGIPTEWASGGRRAAPPLRPLPAHLAEARRRFAWFAQDYVAPMTARDPFEGVAIAEGKEQGVLDLRYGPEHRPTALWGLAWEAPPDGRRYRRVQMPMASIGDELAWVWRMVTGSARDLRPLR